jgi:demethylmenaquinone methyltransferase/2-methoxy-6-polyprenyl-1,4-benzoquinol methylase
VVHTDINEAMLRTGATGCSMPASPCPPRCATPRNCRFAANQFDLVTVAFGLRNMTHKDAALAEMHRVLKPGGKLLVLEFSRVARPLAKAYDWYSFNILPRLGQAGGRRRRELPLPGRIDPHASRPGGTQGPDAKAGFGHVDYHNLTGGVAALHVGIKC